MCAGHSRSLQTKKEQLETKIVVPCELWKGWRPFIIKQFGNAEQSKVYFSIHCLSNLVMTSIVKNNIWDMGYTLILVIVNSATN